MAWNDTVLLIQHDRPHLSINSRSPALPIAIQCNSAEAAHTVFSTYSPLLQEFADSTPREEVARIFNECVDCGLPGPFYGVCYAAHPGVYSNW